MQISIDEPAPVLPGPALFRLAFRPFFLGAMAYAVIAVGLWMAVYVYQLQLPLSGLPAASWHAHEMVFGYAMAVISGFLLTAIKNWTGIQTVNGKPLAAIFLLWLLARIMLTSGNAGLLWLAAVADLLFMSLVVVAAARPVIQAKQFKQTGILAKLVLLLLCNAGFYLGALGYVEQGMQWGTYSAVYIIVALVMVMARRVIPFFIERGVDNRVELKNWKWLDITSLVLLVALWLVDVFASQPVVASWLALILFALHSIRLYGWYTSGIWNKPLLWVLYLAYSFIVLGFALKALPLWTQLSPVLYLHAFTYGGIGVMTMGMMARVILGHTGRDISAPPAVVSLCFGLLIAGTVVRVLFPVIDMAMYANWIAASQILWMLAFGLMLWVYAPMLTAPRVDGRDG